MFALATVLFFGIFFKFVGIGSELRGSSMSRYGIGIFGEDSGDCVHAGLEAISSLAINQ